MIRVMVLEQFRPGARAAIYARVAAQGRMLPPGVRYLDSWVASDASDRCWQVMECDDVALLDTWTAAWADLVTFEIVPVTTSAEAASNA